MTRIAAAIPPSAPDPGHATPAGVAGTHSSSGGTDALTRLPPLDPSSVPSAHLERVHQDPARVLILDPSTAGAASAPAPDSARARPPTTPALDTVIALTPPPPTLSDGMLGVAERDLATLESQGQALDLLLDGLERDAALYTRDVRDIYSPDERRLLVEEFKRLHTALTEFDRLAARHRPPVLLPSEAGLTAAALDTRSPEDQSVATLLHAASQASALAAAVAYELRAGHNEQLAALLNEGHPEAGLPAGAWTDLRVRVLGSTLNALDPEDARRRAQAAADRLTAELLAHPDAGRRGAVALRAAQLATSQLDRTLEVLAQADRQEGQLTRLGRNLVALLRAFLYAIWYPIQELIAKLLPEVDFSTGRPNHISPAQVRALEARLLPGDVFINREDDRLPTLLLPGTWPHAGLYLGRPAQLRAVFDDAPEVRSLVSRLSDGQHERLTELLAHRYPDKWARYAGQARAYRGETAVALEAIAVGVVFTGPGHALQVDHLVALRPNVPLADRAAAILRAFEYEGQPYDFDFDYATDRRQVCTELVFKSYQPGSDMQRGLRLPTTRVAGRTTLPANDLVRWLDAGWERPERPFEFVSFLVGDRERGEAFEATLEQFRVSHRAGLPRREARGVEPVLVTR